MKQYQIEVLLRPAVEFKSAFVSFALVIIAVVSPAALFTPPMFSYIVAIFFFYFTVIDFKDGYRIYLYKRGMKKLPLYILPSKEIPVREKYLFLGKGFLWKAKHTQRLHDAKKTVNAEFVEMGYWYDLVRRLEYQYEGRRFFQAIFLALNMRFSPVKKLPEVGGSPVIHAVGMWEGERDILLPLGERNGHTLVLGTTRVGKTRLCEVFVEQDIRRGTPETGDVTIVFDPKGDADLMRRVYGTAKDCGRPCYIFHLGYPEISCRYNAVGEFSRITEVATRLTEPLSSEGSGAAFKEFAWRFTNGIARAVYSLGRKPGYEEVRRYINNVDPLLKEYAHHFFKTSEQVGKDWASDITAIQQALDQRSMTFAEKAKTDLYLVALVRYVREKELVDPVLEGLMSAFTYEKTYYDKIVASIGPLMDKLTTGDVAALLAPDYDDVSDMRPILDWRNVIKERAVVYIGLDALSDYVVAGTVGNSMFADLTSVAGELYKRGRDSTLPIQEAKPPAINIHADEFNELIGKEFIPMLNKAGGAGYRVTVYTQAWSDVEAKLGDASLAGQVAGNLNNRFFMRVKEDVTAEMLIKSVPDVEVFNVQSVTTAQDSPDPDTRVDFSSSTQDRVVPEKVPAIQIDDILNLPKGQAFAVLEGNNIYKIRLPLTPTATEIHLPKDLEAVANNMKEKYETGDNFWAGKVWYETAAPSTEASAA